MQEKEHIREEAERAKQKESAAAQRKKEAAAALMRSVLVITLTAAAISPGFMCKSQITKHAPRCRYMPKLAPPSRGGPLHSLSAMKISDQGYQVDTMSAQVAAANAALLERKAAEAAQQAAEEQRIAAYIADKAAREQVRLSCRVSPVFFGRPPPHTAMQRHVPAHGMRGDLGLTAHSACCPRGLRHLTGMRCSTHIDRLIHLSRHGRLTKRGRPLSSRWSCGWWLALLTWLRSITSLVLKVDVDVGPVFRHWRRKPPRQASERELKPLLGAGPAHMASKTHWPSAQR